MTEQQIPKLAAALVEHQSAFMSLSTEDAQFVILNTKNAIGIFSEPLNRENKREKYLELISGAHALVLEPTDGTEILVDSDDIFTRENRFLKMSIRSETCPPTKRALIEVYELKREASLRQIFESLSSDVNTLCLTQAQIINFAKEHRGWLRSDGYATYFLFKSKSKFFIADVADFSSSESTQLRVDVYSFLGENEELNAGRKPRVVVRQLVD